MTPTRFRRFTISLELAAQLCAEHGLPAPVSLERVPHGEVSGVFLLDLTDGQSAVLKVYLRNHEPRLLVAEQAIFEHLRRQARLPVPAWTHLNLEGGELGWPYALQQRLPGVDGETVLLGEDLPGTERLLRRVGETLAQLHHVSPLGSWLERADLPSADSWLPSLEAEFSQAVARLEQQGWLEPELLHRARLVWAAGSSVREAPFEPVLCHGDFQLWNLLADPQSLQITGLLDIGQAYWGPAAVDFRDLELNLFGHAPRLRQAFLHGYGWHDFDERERERLRQAALSRALALLAAYWGPTAMITPAAVWHLLAPWSEDAEG